MTYHRIVLSSTAFLVAVGVLPAAAGDYWHLYRHHGSHWHAVHRGIYELENRIAFLEADPQIDDGYKGPIIIRRSCRHTPSERHVASATMAVGSAVLL